MGLHTRAMPVDMPVGMVGRLLEQLPFIVVICLVAGLAQTLLGVGPWWFLSTMSHNNFIGLKSM